MKTYNVLYFFIRIPAENFSESFLASDMTLENDVLMDFLMYFCQKSGCGASLLTPPTLPLGFTAIPAYQRA
jgi:hypothetical protein